MWGPWPDLCYCQTVAGLLMWGALSDEGRLCKARAFRRDSPPTRSRRSAGSGGESSSMLTSVEGNAVQGRMLL
jgi:hypothetical protein